MKQVNCLSTQRVRAGPGRTFRRASRELACMYLYWLGISNFGPHVCRTYWSTHALYSRQISGSNLEDFCSFLEVSSTTLRNNYMAAAANTAANTVGNEVLGALVTSACTGEITEKGVRLYGKKLGARRLEFAGEIRASLTRYDGNGKLLFRALLQKRNASQLVEGVKWFRWENKFFSQSDERLFERLVAKVKM
ncbi:unnamed protein product [Scytosiphon promiscuus]